MSGGTKVGAITIGAAYLVKVRIDRFRHLSPNACKIGKPELLTDLLEISHIAAVKQASKLFEIECSGDLLQIFESRRDTFKT